MPRVRKLSPDEVHAIEYKGKGVRKLTEEQYDLFLSEYNAGDYGEAELEEDEKRLTVRNRLKAAASRRGLSLQFNRTSGNMIRFKVQHGNGKHTATLSDEQPVKRRGGGRPRKVQA